MFSIYYHDLLLNTNSEGSMFQKLIIYKLKENKDSQKKYINWQNTKCIDKALTGSGSMPFSYTYKLVIVQNVGISIL